MASTLPLSQSHSFSTIKPPNRVPKSIPFLLKKNSILSSQFSLSSTLTGRRHTVVVATATTDMPKKQAKGEFVDEMRAVAMKLHTRDQAKEGEKKPESPPVAKWEPSINGYLRFLVDSKLVYDTLEAIVQKAPHPSCMVFDLIVLISSFSVYFFNFILMILKLKSGFAFWRMEKLLAGLKDCDWVPIRSLSVLIGTGALAIILFLSISIVTGMWELFKGFYEIGDTSHFLYKKRRQLSYKSWGKRLNHHPLIRGFWQAVLKKAISQ